MAVVAAFKLDDLAAPGCPARQPDGAHAGFGARAHQPQHLDAGQQLDDFFGELDFALGRGTEAKAVEGGALHRFEHRRVAVAKDHGAPGADVVDVALAVGVPEVGALGALHEARRAAHGLEGAHGRVDAARDELAGALQQGEVAVGHGRGRAGLVGAGWGGKAFELLRRRGRIVGVGFVVGGRIFI